MPAMEPADPAVYSPWLERWQLTPDGKAFTTPSSHLMPVRRHGLPAMLKIAVDEEEKFGALLMRWWQGDGAACVQACEGDALLMERALGGDLYALALHGRDDDASRIACATLARLHAPRSQPAPAQLVPLRQWFRSLETFSSQGGVFAQSWDTAQVLLDSQQDVGVLHGDLHHGNVLDFGERGWLAIDPKRVLGDRGYDFANLLCNPELATVTQPARFHRQLDVIAEAGKLERQRLLRWVLAYAGLSAAWFMEDGNEASAASDFTIARLALAALD